MDRAFHPLKCPWIFFFDHLIERDTFSIQLILHMFFLTSLILSPRVVVTRTFPIKDKKCHRISTDLSFQSFLKIHIALCLMHQSMTTKAMRISFFL